MGKFKVKGSIDVSVETWFEDDEKLNLKDQAIDAIRNAAIISKSSTDEEDFVFIADEDVFSIKEDK